MVDKIKKIIFISLVFSLTVVGSAIPITGKNKNKIFNGSVAGKILDIIMELLAGGIF